MVTVRKQAIEAERLSSGAADARSAEGTHLPGKRRRWAVPSNAGLARRNKRKGVGVAERLDREVNV